LTSCALKRALSKFPYETLAFGEQPQPLFITAKSPINLKVNRAFWSGRRESPPLVKLFNEPLVPGRPFFLALAPCSLSSHEVGEKMASIPIS
jgi:hypothetical protein